MPFKTRHNAALGLLDKESSWGQYYRADFSGVNVAGATTLQAMLAAFPPSTAAFRNPNSFPPTLVLAVGNRRGGTGSTPFAVLCNLWVVHTGSGAIYNPPAGTTVQVKVLSNSLATFGAAVDNLSAAFNLNTGTYGIDPIAITAPTSRQLPYGASGALATTQAALFTGDILYAELVTTGAVNVLGNQLTVIADIV